MALVAWGAGSDASDLRSGPGTNTQVIANKNAWQDAEKRRKIENLAMMLRGAMEAKERVGLMLNVRKEDLNGVLAVERHEWRLAAVGVRDPEASRWVGARVRDVQVLEPEQRIRFSTRQGNKGVEVDRVELI